ncbi:MAG: helix-turn-helix transcriptional regulator, partial [Thiotrichales bacterium]|nr:helix-turn-helix transcriptional regulator [Thiotrichales bacterium]MBT4971574.1 helix-turn-helix transcriptional regulator [Thiotrichales bacterium]MBT5418298.1 helix-turn-helix transcriptional regulator [Thiotrichales bacterium]
MKNSETGKRVAIARKNAGLTQDRLAQLLGVTRGSCGHWEQEINTPSVSNLSRLAIELNVSFEWLATGRGKMEMELKGDINDVSKPSYGPEQNFLNSEKIRIIAAYDRGDRGKRVLILQTSEHISPK